MAFACSSLSMMISKSNQMYPHGKIAILWDIENCPVPNDVRPDDVAGNIRMALKVHPIKGVVTTFSAYGDFNSFPRKVREGCQRTGIKLIDVPNGRKDASDKAILVDMFLFALDCPPPSTIWLISGDVDFAHALHVLAQRGYTIILSIPRGVRVSSALSNAGTYVWDWESIVRGQGFVLTTNENIDYKSFQENSPYENHFHSLPWASPGDINGLKLQLIQLLELSGGCLPLIRVSSEYQRLYGKPLSVSEYGEFKLEIVLKKMSDSITIGGKKKKKMVLLQNWRPIPSLLEEFPDQEKVIVQETESPILEQFKHDLQEILVCYPGGILLSCFEAIYHQRYKKPIDYSSYGVIHLEELLAKVKDIVILHEDPISKNKFVTAA